VHYTAIAHQKASNNFQKKLSVIKQLSVQLAKAETESKKAGERSW
jgi:hypothetical protein